MIVITNPIPIPDEISTIHSLFENGLELLHIRKPDFSEEDMKSFLSEIKLDFRMRLVLHIHHHLADEFRINRIHFSESARKTKDKIVLKTYKTKGFHLSASAHSIDDFNALDSVFEYAFLSPVFPSISKENYSAKINLFEAVKSRTNYTAKLIALGGIEAKNIEQIFENGFDNVALLGTIWRQTNPIQNFKLCRKIVHSY